MSVKNVEAHDVGNDVLLVVGEVDGEKATAKGWVSALTNHFEPHRGEHRPDKAKPREMTKAEVKAYAEGLLAAQASPKPKKIL